MRRLLLAIDFVDNGWTTPMSLILIFHCQAVDSSSPLYSQFEWNSLTNNSAFHFLLNTQQWRQTNVSNMAARSICEVQDTPSTVIETVTSGYDSWTEEEVKYCGQTSGRLPCNRTVHAGCSYVTECTPVLSEIADPVLCCDVSEIPQNYNAVFEQEVILFEGESSTLTCKAGYKFNRVDGSTAVVCRSQQWNSSPCTLNANCSTPLNLPRFAKVLQDSRSSSNGSFKEEELIAISCLTSTNRMFEVQVFTCRGGSWTPDIQTSLPSPACFAPQSLQGNAWLYQASSDKCYGLSYYQITYDESVVTCSTSGFGRLARTDNAEVAILLRRLLNLTNSKPDAMVWVSGKYDTISSKFLHPDRSAVSIPALTTTAASYDGTCILYHTGSWSAVECTSAAYFVCEQQFSTVVDAWTSWSSWSSCSATLSRRRTRVCTITPGTCVSCTGPSTETERCCTDPGHGQNTLRDLNETSVGSVAIYNCQFGYGVSPVNNLPVVLECLSNGKWNTTPPFCTPWSCDIKDIATPADSNTKLLEISDSYQYFYGSHIHRECADTGYVLEGQLVKEREIQCLENGVWSADDVLRCLPIECGRQPAPPNAQFVSKEQPISFDERQVGMYYYKDQATYMCDTDYHFRQSTVFSVICHSDGVFSEATSGCILKVCDRPPTNLPAFTHIANSTPAVTMEVRNLSCHTSYAILGIPENTIQEVRCLELGFWEVINYQPCEIIRCMAPPPATNIQRRDGGVTHNVGEQIRYLCPAATYDKISKESLVEIKCLPNLNWSRPPAECVDIDCGYPGQPTYATQEVEGYKYEQVVVYTCFTGYKKLGSEDESLLVIECLISGEWSQRPLVCVTTSPFHSAKVEEITGNMATLSLVQTKLFNNVNVSYTFLFNGSNQYDESLQLTRRIYNSEARLVSASFSLHYGYIYNISLSTSYELSTNITQHALDIPPVTINTTQPSLIPGADVSHTRPVVYVDPAVSVIKSFKAAFAFPFDERNGTLREISIVVCEIQPFLPIAYFDRKLPLVLPTYQQVQRDDEREVWSCYQTSSTCEYSMKGECGLSAAENGLVGETEVDRAVYTIGQMSGILELQGDKYSHFISAAVSGVLFSGISLSAICQKHGVQPGKVTNVHKS